MASINRWTPFEEALSLRDAMSRLFEESFVRPSAQAGGLSPALDLYETNDTYQIELVVPGLQPDDLEISIQENVLTIAGEYKPAQEQRNYHRTERRYGRFSRSVSFPSNVKAGEVSASCENGILMVTVPKAEEVKPRKIAVQVGGQRSSEVGGKK